MIALHQSILETTMKRLLIAGVLAALLAGCNTIEGVGKDVEAAGRTVSDTARDVKEEIED